MPTGIFMENNLPNRKHVRLEQYDYSTAGAYFITICIHNRRCLLSRVVGRGLAPAEIQYTAYGQIAWEQLLLLEQRYPSLKIGRYVIMPNHIHAILLLEETAGVTPALRLWISFVRINPLQPGNVRRCGRLTGCFRPRFMSM